MTHLGSISSKCASGDTVNVNNFRVLVQKETLKETGIPVGTVLGHVYVTKSVVTVLLTKSSSSMDIDSSLIHFGDSPVPEEWKERLSQKLSKICR